MSIQYGTTTPVSMCSTPPVDRDRWAVRTIQLLPQKGSAQVLLVSALMDGGVPKDRKEVRMNLSWTEVADFPVGAATTIGQALADMIESKAKVRGLLPNEAIQV